MIPNNYYEWRECIEIKCGISLSNAYIDQRVAELNDTAHSNTREFIDKYGEAYRQQIVKWFIQAAQHL